MKKIWILSLLWICLLFTGCFNNRQDLPKNPIVFNETEIDWNWAVENDWKYYLVYSTIKPKWVIWDFNYAFWDCLWYVGDDKNDRIYELNGESADEWLIKYYVNGEMEMPMILREISISNESYIPESVEEPEEDIPEWWWERITVVTDMCEEEWWKLDYWNWAEICVFWEDNRCYFDDLADWNCRNGNIPEEDWTILIPADWMTYRNDEYWFQLKLWKEWANWKIYNSVIAFHKDNKDFFDYGGWVKNPVILFTVPSPRRTWKFGDIAGIIVYTYDGYEQERKNQMNPECVMCSLEEFDNAIIWKNNKYYFLLERSNRAHDELKEMFPSLECREEIDDNIYSHNYWGSYIYCDWIEYINWEPKKTWKDWVEQLFPAESFEFFDVEENAENNGFLEDMKTGWEQPQRINDYPEWWKRITVVTDMCEEEWWSIEELYEWTDKQNVCYFSDDSFCYLDDFAADSCHKGDNKREESNYEYPQDLNWKSMEEAFCSYNDWIIITNEYWDNFCVFEDGWYYELKAFKELWKMPALRWQDEPFCSNHENVVCWVDWVSYVNECWMKSTGMEKDPDAEFVDGKCVKK